MGNISSRAKSISDVKQINVMAFGVFLYVNEIIQNSNDVAKLGIIKVLEMNPEFVIRPREAEPEHPIFAALSPQSLISIEYNGELFEQTMPEPLFNYLCYLVSQVENTQYNTYHDMVERLNDLRKI